MGLVRPYTPKNKAYGKGKPGEKKSADKKPAKAAAPAAPEAPKSKKGWAKAKPKKNVRPGVKKK